MKEIKTLSTILSSEKCKTVKYTFPKKEKGPFIVDDSYFQPVAEALKNLKNGNVTSTERQVYYDFPNGRDDGSKVPANRRFDIKDITELSEAIINETKENVAKIEKAKNKLESEKAMAKLSEMAKKASTLPTDSPNPSQE